MSVLLSNAPVYYALAQARFNPVAAMAKFSSEIQDRMRLSGYTVFETDETQSIDFGDITQAHAKPVITTSPNWFFTKPDRSCGYVLGPDFLVFQSTEYIQKEHFFEELCAGIKIVHDIVRLEALNRIGIRYLNAVLPQKGEDLTLYLNPQVHGIDFGIPWIGGLWESIYQTKNGLLVAKIYKASNAMLGFPADLLPRSVILMERFKTKEPLAHAIIDMDHFSDSALPPDTGIIYENLISLHDELAGCFHAIATDHAFSTWS